MVTEHFEPKQTTAVLFSAGLDSAVLLAHSSQSSRVQPIYIQAGLAWEGQELERAEQLLAAMPFPDRLLPLVTLTVDMRDVYPADHWAVRGHAPAFDSADEDVYLEGRNIVLLAKASVFLARARLSRIMLGPLAGNPFPDATPKFFATMARALSIGLDWSISIETPFAAMHKADVIAMGAALGVPFELTLSCMQPRSGLHCGECSKCRERRDGFREASVADPTIYAVAPIR